jgi:hypothetical protein
MYCQQGAGKDQTIFEEEAAKQKRPSNDLSRWWYSHQ